MNRRGFLGALCGILGGAALLPTQHETPQAYSGPDCCYEHASRGGECNLLSQRDALGPTYIVCTHDTYTIYFSKHSDPLTFNNPTRASHWNI